MISQSRLKEIVSYDPETGLFIRLVTMSNRIKVGHVYKAPPSQAYVRITIDKELLLAHRLAWLYMEGYLPDEGVDHKNGCESDNRWKNLRVANKSLNAKNSKMNSANTSGFCGVFYNSVIRRWIASIGSEGKSIHLGCFETKEEAIECRRNANSRFGFTDRHGLQASE